MINLIKYFLYFSSSVQVYLLQLVTGWDTPQACDSKAAITTASFSSWRALCAPVRICTSLPYLPFYKPGHSRWLLLHPSWRGVISTILSQICSLIPSAKVVCPLHMDSSPRIALCSLILMDVKYLKTHASLWSSVLRKIPALQVQIFLDVPYCLVGLVSPSVPSTATLILLVLSYFMFRVLVPTRHMSLHTVFWISWTL